MDEDRLVMFKRIVSTPAPPLPLPASRDLADLVARLLEKAPNRRLGSGPGGGADVRSHRWFRDLDWAAFKARTLKAPYKPPAATPSPPDGAAAASGAATAAAAAAALDAAAAVAASNFIPAREPAHFAQYRRKPYVSKGNFKDF